MDLLGHPKGASSRKDYRKTILQQHSRKKKEKSTKVSAVRKFACSGWQAEASWPTCLRRCTATVESKTQTN
jgi:hypothetical protein